VLLRVWGSPLIVGSLVVLGVLLNAWSRWPAHARSSLPKPGTMSKGENILFVIVDTLRADHLRLYGYGKGSTPNLDSFAGDAIRFDQAFANASWTRPSFASFLTGRLPASHGVMAKSDA